MKLVGRIPVEPLDDERLTNIERKIVAGAADAAASTPIRQSRLHYVLALAIVAVVVMSAGVIGWRMRGGEPTAVAEVAPVKVDTTTERSTLDIGDARIASDPATAFTVTRPDGGVLVAMTRGRVELEVGKRGDRAPLIVRAGDTDVVVVGTRFSVDFGDGTGAVEVRVTEGAVKVVRQQKETMVAAGEAWTTRDGQLAIAVLEANERAAEAAAQRSGSGDIEIEMGTAPKVGLHDRVAKVPESHMSTKGSGAAVPPRSTGVQRPEHVRPPLDNPRNPQINLVTAIQSQPSVILPALDVGTADATTAMSKYREMISTRGADAAAALYSLAHVQHFKLRRDSDALATLESYRRRFQGGKEYEAALWLRVRILCLRAIDSRCRQAAYTYVHEAHEPKSRSLAELITMTSQ